MTDRELEPLPPEVDALLDAERAAPGPAPAVRARMRQRIFASLGLAAGGGAVATTVAAARTGGLLARWSALSLKAKVLCGLALGSIGAAVPVVAWKAHSGDARRLQVQAAPAVTTVTAPASPPPSLVPAPAPSLHPAATPPPPAAHRPMAVDDLVRERALIERARVHFMRGEAALTLLALREHERDFPRGQLVEEREGLWIRALIARGDRTAASARAAAFRRTFPHSIFLPVIDSALGE